MNNIEKKKQIREINKRTIRRMRGEGKSLYEISLHVNLTCERVRQIERDVLKLPVRGHKKAKRIQRKCGNPNCSNIMTVKENDHRQNCSKKCYLEVMPHKTPEQKRIEHNARILKYYHENLKHDPKFIRKKKIRNKRAAEKARALKNK
jgi:endogenous inhibitor of DNA gyrase (YacG/DUF329 family)